MVTKYRGCASDQRDIVPGDRVAFLSRPTVLHTLAWFSVIRVGAIATNLHLLEKPERLAETVAWLDAKIVIFDSEFSDLVQGLARNSPQVRFIQIDEFGQGRSDAGDGLDAGAPKDPVAIVLSSGSTGDQKASCTQIRQCSPQSSPEPMSIAASTRPIRS